MKTLITGAFKYTEEQLQELKKLGLEIQIMKDERMDTNINLSEIEFVICNSLFLYHDIRKFNSLKIIQFTSAGLDRVPLEYIKEKNIKIFNARGVYSIPMAEWTILKILEIYKHSKSFYEKQEKHIWEKDRDILELNSKTACIIGYGNVGQEIAKRLKAFNMTIIAIDKKQIDDNVVDRSYLISDIKGILKYSDINIFTLPLTEETRGIVDRDMISYMKDNTILINIARGALVNEEDLIDMIEKGKFLGVFLDVFENEPLKSNSKLWDFENVIITPHNSFVSENNGDRLYKVIYENIKSNMEGVKNGKNK